MNAELLKFKLLQLKTFTSSFPLKGNISSALLYTRTLPWHKGTADILPVNPLFIHYSKYLHNAISSTYFLQPYLEVAIMDVAGFDMQKPGIREYFNDIEVFLGGYESKSCRQQLTAFIDFMADINFPGERCGQWSLSRRSFCYIGYQLTSILISIHEMKFELFDY